MKSQKSFLLYPYLVKEKSSPHRLAEMKDLLSDNDLYEDPELEEIKVPISIFELKRKAVSIFEKRQNMLKGKSTTPETRAMRSIKE